MTESVAANDDCPVQRPPQVLASATAEQLRAGPVPLWEIRVEGGWSFDLDGPDWPTHRRAYTIDAVSDSKAAFEAISRFVEGVGNMGDPEAA